MNTTQQPELMTTPIKSPCFYYTKEALVAHVKPQAAQYLESAEGAMSNNEPIKAIELYKKALGLHPTSTLIMVNLGTLLAEQGMAKEGIEQLEAAVKRDEGKNAVAFYNLGTLMFGYGAFEAAKDYLERALALEPSNPHIINNLALLEYQMHHEDKAQEMFEKAFQEHADFAPAAHNLGMMAFEKKDAKKAIEWLQKAHAVSPNAATINSLACAMYSNGQVNDALKLLYECIHANPHYRMPYYNVGFMVYEKKLLHNITIAQ